MKQYINSFICEAEDLLNKLEEDLLTLEKDPGNDDLINNIFRVMHSLKGAAGMFGYENMQVAAHECENVYSLVRSKKQPVTPQLIDITLKGADMLKKMLHNNDKAEGQDVYLDQLKSKFNQHQYTMGEKTLPVDNNGADSVIYGILFHPDASVFERGINPATTLTEFERHGTVKIITHGNGLSWQQQKEKKICNTCWEIYFKTNIPTSGIENIFMFYYADEFTFSKLAKDAIYEGDKFAVGLLKFYRDFEKVRKQILASMNSIDAGANEKNEKKQPTTEIQSHTVNDSPARRAQNDHPDNSTMINIPSAKIDTLLNMVSELVASTSNLQGQVQHLGDPKLNESMDSINKLTKQFRINALELRLVPINSLLVKFKRQVRDLSRELGKEVELIVETNNTEIDKTILNAIEMTLLHIIRNSIDHGIEPPGEREKAGKSPKGFIKVSSFYSGANVIIQVQDDGRGIHLEKVKKQAIEKGLLKKNQEVARQELVSFIMEPGFTTKTNANMVSGRGVGMDVVKKELNKVKGTLEIDTEQGLGTYITLKLPVTLSIIDTLMIEVSGGQFLLPLPEVEYCYDEKPGNIFRQEKNYLRFKDELVPFISLHEKFGFAVGTDQDVMVVIINKFGKKYALIVDQVIGEQQTVIKNLGPLFINQPYFSGGNIMMDGKIALIIDSNYLFRQAFIN